METKYKTLFAQDECAPDAKQYFDKQFEDYFGMSLPQYIEGITPVDGGDIFTYHKHPYRLLHENPGIWTVQIELPQSDLEINIQDDWNTELGQPEQVNLSEYQGDPQIKIDFESISNALQIAKEHNLEVEVLYSAFQSFHSTTTMSISEALEDGLNEWIK